MRKETTIPAGNKTEISTLDMWLNSENKLFTNLFADSSESITNKKMLLDVQLLLSLTVLLSFSFINPIMTLICLGWFASSVMLVRQHDNTEEKGGTK